MEDEKRVEEENKGKDIIVTNKSIGEKRKAWSLYNESKDEVPAPSIIIEGFQKIAETSLEAAAVLSVIFLTNSRICEVIPYSYNWVPNKDRDETGHIITMTEEKRKELMEAGKGKALRRSGVRFKDIFIEQTEEGDWLHIRTRVEKGRNPNVIKMKEATIPLSESYYLYPLVKILDTYLESIGWFNPEKGYRGMGGEWRNYSEGPEAVLFKISYGNVREKSVRVLGIPPHVYRNIRSKYLAKYEKFNLQDLMEWTQWVNPELAIKYSHSDLKEIKTKMESSLGKV